MKSLHIALVAVSLSAAALAAQAPANAAENGGPQASHEEAAKSNNGAQAGRTQPGDADDCVGPVSFCNVYFGS